MILWLELKLQKEIRNEKKPSAVRGLFFVGQRFLPEINIPFSLKESGWPFSP